MIIYRQKIYSTRLAKSMYKLEKIRDKLHTKAGDKAFKKVSDSLLRLKNYGEDIINPDRVRNSRNIIESKINYNRPSPARRAISDEKNIVNSIRDTRNSLESIAYNPGQAVNKATEATLRNPVAVTSQVAGKVTMVADPSGLGAYPFGTGGAAIEHLAKKGYPSYDRFTKRAANGYKKKLGKYVESGTNTIVNSLKNLG